MPKSSDNIQDGAQLDVMADLLANVSETPTPETKKSNFKVDPSMFKNDDEEPTEDDNNDDDGNDKDIDDDFPEEGGDDDDNPNDDDDDEAGKKSPKSNDGVITALLNQVTALQAKLDDVIKSKSSEVPKKPETKKSEITPFEPDSYLLTKEEIDNVVDDPKLINKAISRAVSAAVAHVVEQFNEKLAEVDNKMTALPEDVSSKARAQIELNSLITSFYRDNPDLGAHREYVSFTVRRIAEKTLESGGSITWGEALEKAAKEVRKTMGIKSKKSGNPALPGNKSAGKNRNQPAKKSKNSQQAHMMDIL